MPLPDTRTVQKALTMAAGKESPSSLTQSPAWAPGARCLPPGHVIVERKLGKTTATMICLCDNVKYQKSQCIWEAHTQTDIVPWMVAASSQEGLTCPCPMLRRRLREGAGVPQLSPDAAGAG